MTAETATPCDNAHVCKTQTDNLNSTFCATAEPEN